MDSVDLTTAASALGLSVATLRKRLQRGTIAGFKAADGTWRVVLGKVDSHGQGMDNAGQDHSALVETLRDEVQFLRGQLQARDDDIRRLHVLLQQHQQQPGRALPDHRPAQLDWMQGWMNLWLWWMPR
jgi:hypothetical protein